MKYNNSMFTKEEKRNILSSYLQLKDFNKLIEETSYTKEELFSILLSAGIPNDELVPHITIPSIDEKKILIISDTHLGSIYNNISYIFQTYEYALLNNISTIIHLGDLFQSTIKNVSPNFIDPSKQLLLAISIFEQFPTIKTYILLGNHDLHLLKKDSSFYVELSSLSNLIILGYKKAYLTWQNIIISLHHPTTKYDLTIPYIQEKIKLYGHRHQLHLKDDKIFAPPLSDDVKTYNDEEGIPGFIIMTINQDEINIEVVNLPNKSNEKKLIYKK